MNLYNNEAYYGGIYHSNEMDNLEKVRSGYRCVAAEIKRMLNPTTVLDVGCSIGAIVSAMREIGVESYGVDVSEYAISLVKDSEKQYVHVQDVMDDLPSFFPQHYDVVTCIEVAEHIPPENAARFIARLCDLGDYVVFSSTPYDFVDPTHCNVQQQEYWCKLFAQQGFFRCDGQSLKAPTEWTMCFSRQEMDTVKLVERYERRNRIDAICKKEHKMTVLVDYGDGFETEKTVTLPFVSGQDFAHSLPLNNAKKVRILPVQNLGCIISHIELVDHNKAERISATNGIVVNNRVAFTTLDPFVDFDPTNLIQQQVEVQGCVFVDERKENVLFLRDYLHEVTNKSELQSLRIEELQKKSDDSGCCIAEMKSNLEKQAAVNSNLEAKLAKQEKEHREVQQQVDCLRADLAEQRNGNEEAERKIDCLKAELVEQKNKTEEAKQQVNRLKTKLVEQKVKSVEAEKLTDSLERKLAESTSEVENCHAMIAGLNCSLEEKTEQERRNAHFEAMFCEIQNATWWKITKPGRMITGLAVRSAKKAARGLRLKKIATAWRIYRREGKAGIKRVLSEKKGHVSLNSVPQVAVSIPEPEKNTVRHLTVQELYRDTGNPVHAIPTIISDEPVKRLNLVTDTIESSSLLGGVATALIVATNFCVKYGYELRIITRNAEPVPMNYENILKMNQLERPVKVTYYSDFNGGVRKQNYKMEITTEDIFFATSWWSAEAIRRTTLRKRFFYIIQEAETFFYHYGGERVMCESIMNDSNIDFIVNSHFLYEYFEKNEPNVYQHGVYFEPAFSDKLFFAPKVKNKDKEKHRIFFYGRPHNPRNLFNYGVNVLDEAIRRRIIDTKEWEICFAGANVSPVTFCDGSKSKAAGQMSWEEYAAFLRDVDLALCLMYTPHPSYPPFDVACSGGIVVSNKYLTKQDFPQSKNVLMADLTMESLLTKLEEGINLALDGKQRRKNYVEATIPRCWDETLSETLTYMERCTK